MAADHDRFRQGWIESSHLVLVGREPGCVFVAQAEVQGQPIGDAVVVLAEELVVGVLATEEVGRVCTLHACRVAQHPVGEAISSAPGVRWILCIDAGHGPDANILLAIVADPLIVADEGAELPGALALDDSEVVGRLESSTILPLGPLIEGRSADAGVAAPRIVRKAAAGAGAEYLVETGHACLVVDVLAFEKGAEANAAEEVVSAELRYLVRTNVAGETYGDVFALRVERREAQQRRGIGVAFAIVVKTPAREKAIRAVELIVKA